MIIYTPMPTGKALPDQVRQGIEKQLGRLKHKVCATPGNKKNRRGERNSRKKIQQEARKSSDEDVLMMDDDCVLTDPYAAYLMEWRLRVSPTLGAVALWFGRCPKVRLDLPDVDIKCIMIRKELFDKLDFDDPRKHICKFVREQIIKMGYRVTYLDFEHRALDLGT